MLLLRRRCFGAAENREDPTRRLVGIRRRRTTPAARSRAPLTRLSLVGALLGVGLLGVATHVSGATGPTASATTAGLPLYQFLNNGTGPLPWNAQSMTAAANGSTMLGGPHGTSNGTIGAIAYRTASNDVALLTQSPTGTSQWTDLSLGLDAPAPAADPIPFIDPTGAVDVLYVDGDGHLIMLSQNDPATFTWVHTHPGQAWHATVATDLSAITNTTFSTGLANVAVNGTTAMVAARTSLNTIDVITLAWNNGVTIPYVAGVPVNLTQATHAAKSSSDPVVVPGPIPAVAATAANGDLQVFSINPASPTTWLVQDVTRMTGGPRVHGPLAAASSTTSVFVAALNPLGSVELFSAPLTSFNQSTAFAPAAATSTTTSSTTTPTTAPPSTTTTTTANPTPTYPWTALNVTAVASGSPPLGGSLYLSVTPTQITIAGQAANWGDLFTLTSSSGFQPWTSTDVSVTAGSSARTVGTVVTGLVLNNTLSLYAAGVNSPPPQGVGVYAIPFSKWTQSVSDGWPIVSETGGLGTTSSPWVGFTTASSVATSPDFLMGQSLYNAHKRVTWLSFWTISGPLAGETVVPATYYRHGFAAGAWVATQIDQYRSLGVGLKPDWVILDPEGYPDSHSGLDAPGGASNATMAQYTGYWSAMLRGWAAGLASVDPSLNAGVYASQSEYRNYHLANAPMPVFVALAFGGGGPVPVMGTVGSNVRGYIAFSAVCSPPSALASEESTLLNPPWSGQFNTLQFNSGVYCPPAAA